MLTPASLAVTLEFLEFEPSGNLDDAVQSAATNRVRRSDLTKSRTVDVEERVAGSV